MTDSLPTVVGHRGAAAVSPENTLASFARGETDGAAAIELDVHLTADGELAVIHDARVDRTAVGGRTTGAVAELTWPQLQEVELPDGQHIPSLAQALTAIGVDVHVEIKAPAAARPATELVLDAGLGDRVTMTSFDIGALREVREVAPTVAVGVISPAPTAEATDAVGQLDAVSLALQVRHLDPALVQRLQAAGVDVCGWPVLTTDDVRTALEAGVAMMTADDPGWCRDELHRLATRSA
ncbi:glycerophosphodiester phosphodiesterase [Ruania alba]|uniref:Glycerophosphoryl diester phosphodiesterase n=1 Tax=Ruania alba TaxID=648782 RepID=A0A1H5G838_9MICO|nr:glycerophosphodiester phosphodiesterase family protein [Ruania alba]SEE11819.1 glycerophosphoryl diester phosphodiesterase [Ruania alba]